MAKPKYYECDICGYIHPWDFDKDCHKDEDRLTVEDLDDRHESEDHYVLFSWDERVFADIRIQGK